jgi:hypothetical protein
MIENVFARYKTNKRPNSKRAFLLEKKGFFRLPAIDHYRGKGLMTIANKEDFQGP